ncbi:MAG TPA: TetR/AcrR family transcriptional regulator [Opitutaceae bacterium]|nr:TetR/AcrR family transcriptional regulator [Opitutaceae bacterium]
MFATASKTQIIGAARKLVRRRGHAVVSLRQIAAAAGYSPAGLYAHFPGREGIMDEVADAVRGDLAAILERAAAEQAEPTAQLVAVGLAYITFALAHAPEFELLFRYTRSRKRSSVDPLPSSFDLLRRIVRRGTPSASAEEIDLACLRLWSTAHGLANLRAFHLSEFNCDWNAWTRQILQRQVEEVLCSAHRDC